MTVPSENSQHSAPEVAVPPSRPPRRRSIMQGKQPLRNMAWALALTFGVVVLVAVAFFGVGSDLSRETAETSRLDVSESAGRAQALAPFPVADPALEEGWSAQSARFTDGEAPAWQVQYSTPSGRLASLEQQAELSAPMVSAAVPGGGIAEETTVAGLPCQVLGGEDTDGETTALACQGEGYGLVVHGTAPRGELEELTVAAITSAEEAR